MDTIQKAFQDDSQGKTKMKERGEQLKIWHWFVMLSENNVVLEVVPDNLGMGKVFNFLLIMLSLSTNYELIVTIQGQNISRSKVVPLETFRVTTIKRNTKQFFFK